MQGVRGMGSAEPRPALRGGDMRVFLNKRLIVVESNVEWALPYWTERKRINKRITWVLT